MGTQSQDVPFFYDEIAALRQISGNVARHLERTIRDTYLDTPSAPRRGRSVTPADVDEFITQCRSIRDRVVEEIKFELRRTSVSDCVTTAILLGQYDNLTGGPSGSPNLFSYEVELLASICSTVRRKPLAGGRALRAALRALQLARQFQVFDQYLQFAEVRLRSGEFTMAAMQARNGFEGRLAQDWVARRGSFSTIYDWTFSSNLLNTLNRSGVLVPRVETISGILQSVFDHYVPVVNEFRREIKSHDGLLHHIAKNLELLTSDKDATRAELALLRRYSGKLWMNQRELLRHLPMGSAQADAAYWLDALTVAPCDLGTNKPVLRLFHSPLANSPFLVHRRRYLLCLIHTLMTDLSRLMEGHLSRTLGETYYKARAEELELSAIGVLQKVLSGASWIHAGKYSSGNGNDLIEVDGVLRWRDLIFITESKSGYFSMQTRHGSDEAAAVDLRKTMGDGFFQAARLLRRLSDNNELQLTNNTDDRLLLRLEDIRRAYIIVPTADDLGGVTIMFERLWRNGVIPPGATPLVIPVQDLYLIADFLADPIDFISYLDFREEILTDTSIINVDELELLGAFVGGIDILNSVDMKVSNFKTQSQQLRWRNARQLTYMGSDAQERHLNPWILDAFQAWMSGQRKPAVPRRHAQSGRGVVEEIYGRTGNLTCASIVNRLPRGFFESELPAESPSRGKPHVWIAGTVGFVSYSRYDKLSFVKRLPAVQTLRSKVRYVIYALATAGPPRITHAEYGRAHVFFADSQGSLISRSRMGALAEWYDEFAVNRKRGPKGRTTEQRGREAKLTSLGLPETMSIGIVRKGLDDRLRVLHEAGLPISKAANLLNGPLADLLAAHHLAPERLVEAAMLVDSGSVAEQDLGRLIEALHTAGPAASIEKVASSAGLLRTVHKINLTYLVETSMMEVGISTQAYGALGSKARNRVRAQIIGAAKSHDPTVDVKAFIAHLEDTISR